MQVFISNLVINRDTDVPVYMQVSDQLMSMIKTGLLRAGSRLPATRKLAAVLNVHRKTVIRAYDDLLIQGWLESRTGSGTFVAMHFPEAKPRTLADGRNDTARIAGFGFKTAPHLQRTIADLNIPLHLDDGFPDARLAPLHDISRAYRTQLLTGNPYSRLGYADPKGSGWLRTELAGYLNTTRGLRVTAENILIVRGTVMGLYLTCAGLLEPGDTVVTTDPGWAGAESNFLQAGANLVKVEVDGFGMNVDRLEIICQKQSVRLVYVTSHHHYPTTVALRADRRVQLLTLAQKYGFIIFEDDYDYDFHYQNRPLMPLASADDAGMVLYCGAFSKTISPALRVGYLVGPENIIEHLAGLRRAVDRQGDTLLENAMAELLQNGIIQRHLRKSLKIYKQRRDFFCELMNHHLENYAQFKIPEGGMALWTCFDPAINLNLLAKNALKKGLYFQGENNKTTLGFTRLGFASSTPSELENSIEILAKLLKN